MSIWGASKFSPKLRFCRHRYLELDCRNREKWELSQVKQLIYVQEDMRFSDPSSESRHQYNASGLAYASSFLRDLVPL